MRHRDKGQQKVCALSKFRVCIGLRGLPPGSHVQEAGPKYRGTLEGNEEENTMVVFRFGGSACTKSQENRLERVWEEIESYIN